MSLMVRHAPSPETSPLRVVLLRHNRREGLLEGLLLLCLRVRKFLFLADVPGDTCDPAIPSPHKKCALLLFVSRRLFLLRSRGSLSQAAEAEAVISCRSPRSQVAPLRP